MKQRTSTAADGRPFERRVRRLACWWFGCQPDYEAMRHDCEAIPCERCGAEDTSYADRCGDTRHNRSKERLRAVAWHAFWRWLPTRCQACGGRYGCKAGCDGIPF